MSAYACALSKLNISKESRLVIHDSTDSCKLSIFMLRVLASSAVLVEVVDMFEVKFGES